MKRNKVLLGLIVGLMTLAGGSASAQSGVKTGSKFYEVGPTNIAGQISSIVVDSRDTTGTTQFAGATNGGLFFRSEKRDLVRQFYAALGYSEQDVQKLADTAIWHHVPYVVNNREIVLPITNMLQAPDGTIFIGTGDGYVQHTSNYARMSSKGKGIFRFNPNTLAFTQLSETSSTDFAAVNSLDYYYNKANGDLYLFAATSTGLYRWKANSDAQWASAHPERIKEGFIDEVTVSRKLRTAYVAAPFDLFKIGDVTASNIASRIARITPSNPAFASARRIRIAIAPDEPDYVYAMTVTQFGTMDNVYLTRDEQTWTPIATSTVTPFSFVSGTNAGAITVDPTNSRRIIIAGDNIWVGQGYVDGALYQWTTASYSEHMLNGGDFMSQVFGSYVYVHSGIHCIVPARNVGSYTLNGERVDFDICNFYIGTNGGIYVSGSDFNYYTDMSRGLNTTAVTSIAVAPDGTLVTGARDNNSPVIEPILTHSGGQPTISWFDDGSLGNFNHDANVLFHNGTGGATAASAFQQYSAQNRRTIFTSNSGGQIGRAWIDYLDYTNTTAWTTGNAFNGDGTNYGIANGPEIGSLYLWETTENTVFNSYIRQGVDTLSYIIRGNDTLWVNDTAKNGTQNGSKFRIQRGDKVNFHSRAHNNYPFEYTFTSAQTAKDSVTVRNPIQSRMVAIGDFPGSSMGGGVITTRCVWFSWAPTDFTKVWDSLTFIDCMRNSALSNSLHLWSPILGIERIEGTVTENLFPRNAVISRDGLNVYVSAFDTLTRQSVLFRIRGFETIDFTNDNYDIYNSIIFQKGSRSLLSIDTFHVNGSIFFPRPISSLAIDPRQGVDRLIITFDGVSDNYANVAVIDNPRTNWSSITEMPITGLASEPAFCAIAEDSTGTLYVGTSKGVYTKADNAAWQVYSNIPEIPVTAIAQQTKKLPIRHTLTHTGITPENNAFAKTKWPRAIYFGTYGRGIFMDMTYVTDTVNEIVDPVDYTPVPIPAVNSIGLNSVSLYPNPVSTQATLEVQSAVAGTAQLRVYDLNGRCVIDRQLGFASEGANNYTLQTENLSKGMYLVNVIIGGHTAATKMMVR